MIGQKVFYFDELMILKDCVFLGSVYFFCEKDLIVLDLGFFLIVEIQDLVIVFKKFDGKNRYIIFLMLLYSFLYFQFCYFCDYVCIFYIVYVFYNVNKLFCFVMVLENLFVIYKGFIEQQIGCVNLENLS